MNVSFLGRLGLVPLGVSAFIGLAVTAWGATPPPNDNFANAIVIAGFWGTTNADLTAATAEPGEPAHAGAPAANSVWYKLIAIENGTMTIHTFGSAAGTRLAVYTVAANTNAAVNGPLFPVAANMNVDFSQFFGPGPVTPSAVKFPVTQGSAYYVAVDSSGPPGKIQLTWGYNFGGLFCFTKPEATYPLGVAAAKTEGAIQFSVTRCLGYAGQVLVDVVTTNYTGPNTPAANGVDYIGGKQTLTFENYETVKSFSVPIMAAPEPPPSTNGIALNPNVYFDVQIVAVRFDPQENTNLLAPPVIMTGSDKSVGQELEMQVPAGMGDPGPQVFFSTNLINFRIKHHVTTEQGDPGDGGYAEVWFEVDGLGDHSCSCAWGINSWNILGDLMNNQFDLWPESDYATPPPPTIPPPGLGPEDFHVPCKPGPTPWGDGIAVGGTGSSGTVTFGSSLPPIAELLVPINDDTLPEFNEDFEFELGGTFQSCLPGEVYTMTVTISFDVNDQPAGALEAAYNPHNQPPNNLYPGANATIFALAVQPDQNVVIGGAFTDYNSFLRNRIARVYFDGTIDTTFNPGTGADGLVTSLALQPDGNILMGGDFHSVNGINRYHVARLNTLGGVDTTFNPGVGADDTVWSLALSTNGSIVLGGQFDNFNNYPRDHVARLDAQGNVDLTFDTSNLGLDGTVWTIAPQPDGKVVIGGDFTVAGGLLRSRIARLNADGSLDTTFDPGLGANDTVYTLLVQATGEILVGGAFTQFHTALNQGLTRLLPSGALDTSFNPGLSANNTVYSVFFAPAEDRIYVGGMFTAFNSTRRVGLARLFPDGTVDTSFLDTAYNQFAGLINPIFNPDRYPNNVVYAIGQENVIVNSNLVQDVVIGGSFDLVGGGGKTRHAYDHRENLALLRGGATVGPGNITLTYPNGSGLNNADKSAPYLQLTLTRTNGTLGTVATRFSPDPLPVGPGAAIYGQDYSYDPITFGLPSYSTTWGPPGSYDTRMLSDGIWWRNFPDPMGVFTNVLPFTFNLAQVDMLNNISGSGNVSYNLNLTIPEQADSFFLGGANMPLGTALGPQPSTPSSIIDNRNPPGTFSFITTNYTVSETARSIDIMVIRTGGSGGQVNLKYLTQDIPGTPPPGIGFARSNKNYYAASGPLTFRDGITNQSFTVKIIDDTLVDPNLALLLVITNIVAQNPMNGTPLGGITNAWLTIIDGDSPGGLLNFSVASFATNETAGNAVITVTRTGSSQGTMTVLCSTTNTVASPTNTPAVPGVNYLPVTNVLLVWTNGDSLPKTFTVPVLHDNVITPNLTVGLQLSTPVLNGTPLPYNLALGLLSNAVLTVINVDSLGVLSFSSPTYSQNESGGFAIVPVVREGGSVGTISATFNTTAGTNTTAGIDFIATNGTLTFGPGEVSKVFTVPLIDNYQVDLSNRTVVLQLTNPVPSGVLSYPSTASLNIVSDGVNQPPGGHDPNFLPVFNGAVNAVGLQPNGAVVAGGAFTVANSVTRNRLARLNADGTLDYTFASQPGGADDAVRALALQTDGRILIAGDFANYDASSRNHFARVNLDGTLDWQFDPGSALDHSAYAVVETFTDTNQTVRQVLVGGSFTLANGAQRLYLARFNDDGSVDLGFNADNGAGGINGPVWAIAVQTDRKIIIGGDFVTINGVAVNHIARLNPDGSLDYSFDNPGSGAGDSVRALTLQLDGRILVGGLFINFNGTVQNSFARLNADGSLDPTFNGGAGTDGAVYTIALQPDTRILLGGAFTRCDGVTRNGLTRLNPDGSVDTTINFGAGCNSYVASLLVQPNDAIVLGGGFTTYDGAPAPYLTRIFGRSVAGSGTFEFTSATFGAYETASNAVVTVRRRGGTTAPTNGPNVYVTVATSDGYPPNGATNGINYLGGLFTNAFPPGETFATVLIPVLHDFKVTPDLTVNLQLSDIEPLGLAGLGNQPIATLFISNVDSAVYFSSASYSIAKNDQAGRATIPIYRFGSIIGEAQVDFMTTGGTAQPGGRYLPVMTNAFFSSGQTTQNVFIPIINDSLVLGNQTVTMALVNPVNTLLSTPSAATLTIIETTTAPGTLAFSAPSYVVNENGTNAYLNVVRANGITGTVTADYFTRDGTAVAGVNYVATNGTLVFASGDTNTTKTIVVPINYLTNVTGNEVFSVVLTNATGGATLTGPTTVPVTIVDVNVGLSFSAPIYVVSETAGTVSLSVFRQNGANLTTTVQYSTADLTATAGINYVGITNATLTFNPGETTKNFSVRVLHDPRITGDLQFAVNLFNPSAPAALFNYPSAVVNVLDTDTGFSFGTDNRLVITNTDLSTVTNASYTVLKSGTNVSVTIVRTNANTGTVSVNYTTATNLTDTAVAGEDYGATSGLLTFSNLVSIQSFTVPIFNNRQITGNRTFSIDLFNPAGGAQLIPPTNATVTIIDDVSGISFSSSGYRVNENGGAATITVLRTNFTGSVVSVNYSTAGLTATAGINYSNVSGTLTFNPGETVKTFSVPVIDDGVLNGDTTVLLSLGTLAGNAVFVNPSSATLTIVETDGSLIIPAGSALTSESFLPPNGVIDPGETVSLLFALRDSTGTNTVNLVATLLATNGITKPSPPQTYGALAVHGPSVSKQFSFTASGVNGQTISATFQLQDGTVNRGPAVFNFTLGQSAASFASSPAIIVSDSPSPGTAGLATPYPSVININGLAGLVSKATVTLSNLNYAWPVDLDALLVSPTGQKSLLMAQCGGGYQVNNATLIFDDAAASSLPQNSLIVSGTNRPTSYALTPPIFPPGLTPSAPYSTNLSVFNGNNPNGAWSLYLIDDAPGGGGGVISNGWTLSLSVAGVVMPTADVGLAMTAAPATVVASSNLTYTLTLTNYGPSTATNIVVTNTLPAGMAYVSSSPSLGNVSTSAGVVSWTIASLAMNAKASLALVVRASMTGVITNTAGVTTGTSDLNPDDDIASAVVTVVSPTADLALGLADAPDPVLAGSNLTYTITVQNLGPATATGVVAFDTLPPTVNFISASPANNYTVVGQLVTFTNLGNLASGAQTNLTIVVQPAAAGTITDSASCYSGIVDPLKANNSAAVKTIVQSGFVPPLTLSISLAGSDVIITWPVNPGNSILESATNLYAPVVWYAFTNPPPVVVGGQNTVTVPIGGSGQFFRLHGTNP